MDVKEKIMELLTEFYGVDPMYHGVDANALADHLIAHGVTVQNNTQISDELLKQLRSAPIMAMTEEPAVEVVKGWISVKDRLPDESGYYLIRQKEGTWLGEVIQTARWNKTTQRFRGAQAGCYMEFVTHWMPLPQPPKGE